MTCSNNYDWCSSDITRPRTCCLSCLDRLAAEYEKVKTFWWQAAEDWAETDTEVRKLAAKVLSDEEAFGNADFVPDVIEIVESLVLKLEDQTDAKHRANSLHAAVLRCSLLAQDNENRRTTNGERCDDVIEFCEFALKEERLRDAK